jgi:protein SCO1/2
VNPRVLIALLILAVAALGAALLAAGGSNSDDAVDTGSSRFEGAIMPKGFRAPDFRLRDQDGHSVSMRQFRGKPVIVTFLYTTCDNECPAMAQVVKGALDDLKSDVPAIAVAVDPPHDNAERARAFLAKQRAIGRLDFVLGSRPQLARVWKGFAIQPQTVSQEHQARFTLVDKRGFQRIGFPGNRATPEAVAHDVALLERD